MILGFIKKLFEKPFFRFLLAGGVNALFSYGCFSLLMLLIKNKEVAVTLNLLISVCFNYFTSSKYVFRRKAGIKPILKFYAVYFITYPINLLHLHFTVDVWGWNVYLAQFLSLLYIPLISFFLQRKLVFKSVGEDKEDDCK